MLIDWLISILLIYICIAAVAALSKDDLPD